MAVVAGGQRRVLGHGRRRDVEVLRQLLDLAHIAIGCYQPTETPARHAKVLGEAVDDKHLVADCQCGHGIDAVAQAVINLIYQQGAAAVRGDVSECRHGFWIKQSARRIRR